MLSRLVKFFELNLQPKSEAVSRQHRLNLAACVLMLEVARLDQRIDAEELEVIAQAGQRWLELSEADVDMLMSLAAEEAKSATSLYQFTSLIHEHYDEQQKFELLCLMWDVALADGRIEALEEHLIRRVADLLYIPHVKFVNARHLAQQARKGDVSKPNGC